MLDSNSLKMAEIQEYRFHCFVLCCGLGNNSPLTSLDSNAKGKYTILDVFAAVASSIMAFLGTSGNRVLEIYSAFLARQGSDESFHGYTMMHVLVY